MSRTRAGSTFAVVFRVRAGAAGVRALRALLKTAKRRFNLRCLEARAEARQDSQRLRESTTAEIPARAGIAPDGSGKSNDTGDNHHERSRQT
jgi:hypothetical protein